MARVLFLLGSALLTALPLVPLIRQINPHNNYAKLQSDLASGIKGRTREVSQQGFSTSPLPLFVATTLTHTLSSNLRLREQHASGCAVSMIVVRLFWDNVIRIPHISLKNLGQVSEC